jgi:hypothetical protein
MNNAYSFDEIFFLHSMFFPKIEIQQENLLKVDYFFDDSLTFEEQKEDLIIFCKYKNSINFFPETQIMKEKRLCFVVHQFINVCIEQKNYSCEQKIELEKRYEKKRGYKTQAQINFINWHLDTTMDPSTLLTWKCIAAFNVWFPFALNREIDQRTSKELKNKLENNVPIMDILDTNPNLLNKMTRNWDTCILFECVKRNSVDILSYIIEYEDFRIDLIDNMFNNVIHICCQYNSFNVLEFLFKRIPEIIILMYIKNSDLRDSFQIAVQFNRFEIIKFLLKQDTLRLFDTSVLNSSAISKLYSQ